MTMQYELYKITKYQTKLKQSTQKSKSLIYKSKLNYHLYNLNQHGGIFYKFDLSKKNLNDHIFLKKFILNMFSKFTHNELVTKKDWVGQGDSGIVYAFSNDTVIKFIENLDIFRIEQLNNNLVNILSSYNPFFPKYYYMDVIPIRIPKFKIEKVKIPEGTSIEAIRTLKIQEDRILNDEEVDEKNIGIIITDKLSPIYDFFQETRNGENNKTYKNFKDNFSIENRIAFYKQFYFILYSIYDLYRRTGSILLHNDIKMDNFLIKEIKDDDNIEIIIKLFNDIELRIPYIVYNDKKYILILNDYGNSYTYNSQTLTESFPSNDVDSILVLKFKFLETDSVSNKLFKNAIIEKITNLSYIDIEMRYMEFFSDIDKFIFTDSKRYFKIFKNNIININLPINKII